MLRRTPIWRGLFPREWEKSTFATLQRVSAFGLRQHLHPRAFRRGVEGREAARIAAGAHTPGGVYGNKDAGNRRKRPQGDPHAAFVLVSIARTRLSPGWLLARPPFRVRVHARGDLSGACAPPAPAWLRVGDMIVPLACLTARAA